MKAEWRHNRKNLVTKVVVGAVIASLTIACLRSQKDDSRTEVMRLPR